VSVTVPIPPSPVMNTKRNFEYLFILLFHLRSWHSLHCKSPASHCGSQVSIPCQFIWDLWSTKWHWSRFLLSSSKTFVISRFTKCSVCTNHPVISTV
jgi:hypothetical protein